MTWPPNWLREGPVRWIFVYAAVIVVGLSLGIVVTVLRGAGGPLGGTPAATTLVLATRPASTPVQSLTAVPAPGAALPAPAAAAVSPVSSLVTVASPSAAPSPSPVQSYVVRPGDTLRRIAQEVYGDSNQWMRLYDANRDTIGPDPNNLRAGMALRVP